MATATSTDRLYEAMFLLTPGAAADMAAALEHITEILGRAKAEIVVLRKWDDRRMAYAIRNQKRGTYVIAYFNAPSEGLAQIDRDSNLSERIVRVLITKADHLGETEIEEIKKDTGPRPSSDSSSDDDDRKPARAAADSDESDETPEDEGDN